MLRRNQTIRPTTTTQEMTLARGRIQRSPSARSRLKVDREDNQELNRPYTSPRTRSASPVARSPRSIGELPLKKLSNIYAKIVTQLEMVKDLSENRLNETENILDLRRQLQRADEFSIRFSRNNLYDTKRLLNEIKNMLVPYPFENMSPVEARTLSKKIILAYQAASQSLQIYINYVKNPGNLEVPDKISELVLLIAELLLCCEQLSLSSGEVHLQHDAVKICNELLAVLKSKPPVGEYLDIKQEVLTRKKHKKSVPQPEDATKLKNLSMYKARPGVKGKPDMPARKKAGLSCLLGNVNKKSNKKEEKMARITHEIYTQKMNPKPVRPFGNKNVKFDQTDQTDRGVKENATGKKPPKKSRYFTPREVRSQDDDVETMVQTIDDDDFALKIDPTHCDSDGNSDSSTFNRTSFRELLMNAIEDLQGTDKREQKATLKKLLTSIQTCFKGQRENNSRHSLPAVKVYHFKHKDSEDEEEEKKDEESNGENEEGEEETKMVTSVDLKAVLEKNKAREEILFGERRLNVMFKPIGRPKQNKPKPETASIGKIRLKLDEETMEEMDDYRKSFAEFTRNNIMYIRKNRTRPWELVGRMADHIIMDIIRDIASDFQNDSFLQSLYESELLEVIN